MATVFDRRCAVRMVVPRGSLLGEEADALRRRLGEAVADNVARIVVDLRPARYVSARAIAVMTGLQCELRRRGGDLKLLGVRPSVRELLDLCGLGATFDCLASEDEIAASFKPQAIRRTADSLRPGALPTEHEQPSKGKEGPRHAE